MDDHVVDQVGSLSDDRIRNASGEVICQEEETTVSKIIKTLIIPSFII